LGPVRRRSRTSSLVTQILAERWYSTELAPLNLDDLQNRIEAKLGRSSRSGDLVILDSADDPRAPLTTEWLRRLIGRKWADRLHMPAVAPSGGDDGFVADPLGERAAVVFAAELAADHVPSVRAIRAALHVGQPRARDCASTSPPSPGRLAGVSPRDSRATNCRRPARTHGPTSIRYY
jgi:hypothetical protein